MEQAKLARASVLLFVVSVVVNLAGVVYHRVMSAQLGQDYAQLATLLAMVNVLSAMTNGLSTTLVRAFGADAELAGPGAVKARLLAILKPGLLGLGAFTLVLLLLLPLLGLYLKVPSLALTAMVAMIFALGVVVLAVRAATQGLHHFRSLGLSMLLDGLGRVGLAWVLVLKGLGVMAGLLGMLGGQALSLGGALTGLMGLGPTHPRESAAAARRHWIHDVREVASDSLALTLFALMGYLDLFVLKHHYPDLRATLYSRTALVAKSFMFLAGAFYLVLLPATARAVAAGRDARPLLLKFLAAAAALNAVGLAFVWAFPEFCLRTLTGPDPATLTMAPLVRWFSLAVVPMALAQLVLGYLLAQRQKGLVPALAGLTLLYYALLNQFQDSEQSVVAGIAVVACLTLALGCWAAFRAPGAHALKA